MLKSLGMLSLCMAILFVFSTTSFAKTKVSTPDGLSRAEVQSKLKKINLVIKSATKTTNACSDCTQAISTMVAVAMFATDICGGPSGSNYNSTACQVALFFVGVAEANYYGQCNASIKLKVTKKKHLLDKVAGVTNRIRYNNRDERTFN